jgi:zinc protease
MSHSSLISKTLLGAAAILAGVATANAADIKIADFKLANGLELVVIPDHRAPVVTHMIWYKVGSADETPANRAWHISSNI